MDVTGRNVLITSGGTAEPIDPVRAITNGASGALGARIADVFLSKPDVDTVYYVAPRTARLPNDNPKLVWVEVSGTDSLESAIRDICGQVRVDAIVHAMAVSDYKPRSVTTVGALADALCAHSPAPDNPAALRQIIQSLPGFDRNHKIRSNAGDLVIITEPTQKVIALLRGLAPQAVIIGFKLLTDVSHADLIRAAQGILTKNDCDYVLANDSSDIDRTHHIGYLIDRQGHEQRFDTKADIAAALVAATYQSMEI
ncbi:MAG: hypothetical protein LBC29_05565 [Propionibacteriaceae bacterium]|jgi:phosphopantothenate-cysteine ligase|nr:hypothetical protein [Propionibacteriaceae bacterium]